MIKFLATAAHEELAPTRTEKDVDAGAHELLRLCGFFEDSLEMGTGEKRFDIFGSKCSSIADHYIIHTANDELVLVWEDKSLREGEAIPQRGHVGQIMGELLQLLSVNRKHGVFRTVFAVRYINYNVTAFRVDADEATLDTLVTTANRPAKKLKLLCSVKHPATDRGLSLIDNKERGQAMRLLAAIRGHILR